MAKTSLPPGFRFHPTDVELVKYYLKRKVMGKKLCFEAIAEVDIYKHAPWDLPDKSCMRTRDLKWYFFCPREKKYANGARMNRATEFGYWKTTGKDRPVHYNNEVVGMIKTLVFHQGKAPRGDRTDWVMHEYRIEEKALADRGVVQDAYVLCIVFRKDGPGPRNGAQYGAPFREEDWIDDDNDEDVNCVEVVSTAVFSAPVPNQVIPLAASSIVPEGRCVGSSESCLSDAIPSANKVLPPAIVGDDVPNGGALFPGGDDIVSMLDLFVPTENGHQNSQDKNHDNEHNENVEATPSLDGVDIYDDLADLGNLGGGVQGDLYDFIGGNNVAYNMNQMFMGDNEPYIELLDLDPPLNGPAEAGQSGLNHTDELVTDQNCYNSEQLCNLFNPVSNQSLPMLPEEPIAVEDPLVAFFKEDGVHGNANQALLNHGDVSDNYYEEVVMLQQT
ncbi:hypothetical protein ACOSQ2_022630 [Xanthoceras sorbifolium]